jgi:hypothetical protein
MFEIRWPAEITPPVSKYNNWYNQLIFRAKNRTLLEGTYIEKHHVIPKSFGGDNSKNNLVKLLAREHYIAHLLLWKMKFPGMYHSKMAFAFNTFMNKMQKNNPLIPNSTHAYKINSKLYESFRTEYAALLSEKMKGVGNHYYGKTHSEEIRRKIGEKSKLKEFKRGPEHPSWGKTLNISEEGKKKRSDAVRQMWDDPVRKQEILEKRREAMNRPEVVARRKEIADSKRGVKRDPAIIEKGAAKKRGKKGNELFSEQALKNMREAAKNRVLSAETKEKIRQTLLKCSKMPKSDDWKRQMSARMKGIQRQKYKCVHCGTETVLSNINRWHNDNCKKKDLNNVKN